jgi:UDP:flavonoid glycosyltransferase YjiC (YdhE family)
VLLATAGRCQPAHVPANVQVADYLPGSEAARRSALVICNGGSSTAYQAIAEGVPVLGIPSNLDQYLAMTAIERAQAGLLLRTQRLTPERVRAAVLTLLHEPLHRAAAQRLATTFARYDAKERFGDFVARAAGGGDGVRDLGQARDRPSAGPTGGRAPAAS